jgi:Malonate transporter MadL subunit.
LLFWRFCTLVGVFVGDLLGIVLGVKANVGGVGLAMMLLMAARVWLIKPGSNWGSSSGPPCTSLSWSPWQPNRMSSRQFAAARSSSSRAGRGLVCFAAVALIGHIGRDRQHEIEAEPDVERGGHVIAGELEPELIGKKA